MAEPTARREVAVVTPWYPTPELPYRGAFVQAMVQATAPECDRLSVYHCDEWLGARRRRDRAGVAGRPPRAPAAGPPSRARASDPPSRGRAADLPTPVRTVGGADLLHVPADVPTGLQYAEISDRHARALRRALGGRRLPAGVVHAHVGLLGGWAAVRNARRDARVFVTEHASFLDRMLAQPEARDRYDELIDRCTGFFAVGEAVRGPLVAAFPHHADRITVMPNPVDFTRRRAAPVTALRRWLYVGALVPAKGVLPLLDAFARCRARQPELTLTLVGDGPLRAELGRRAGQLGVDAAVRFTGAVRPRRALALMREHDLLVHPSHRETFGMTVVEAVAAGMAVLVARCGGPQETLAGVHRATAGFFAPDGGAPAIVRAYRRLSGRFPDRLDLDRARAVLADRYGYPAVAAAHRRIWFGDG